jgi:hypothetical protein
MARVLVTGSAGGLGRDAAAAVARRWPGVFSNAVDPGWVPTRMGGPGAPDELELGHVAQPQATHPAVLDKGLQDRLLDALARRTGVRLP